MESLGIIWNILIVKWGFSYLVNCYLTWVSSHSVCFPILLSNQIITYSVTEDKKQHTCSLTSFWIFPTLNQLSTFFVHKQGWKKDKFVHLLPYVMGIYPTHIMLIISKIVRKIEILSTIEKINRPSCLSNMKK